MSALKIADFRLQIAKLVAVKYREVADIAPPETHEDAVASIIEAVTFIPIAEIGGASAFAMLENYAAAIAEIEVAVESLIFPLMEKDALSAYVALVESEALEEAK